jgi:hypothetical protein
MTLGKSLDDLNAASLTSVQLGCHACLGRSQGQGHSRTRKSIPGPPELSLIQSQDEGKFDPKSIPEKTWRDYEYVHPSTSRRNANPLAETNYGTTTPITIPSTAISLKSKATTTRGRPRSMNTIVQGTAVHNMAPALAPHPPLDRTDTDRTAKINRRRKPQPQGSPSICRW